jgi:hypothetical protein
MEILENRLSFDQVDGGPIHFRATPRLTCSEVRHSQGEDSNNAVAGEIIFEGQWPIVLNGIEELVTRTDLLDRSLFIDLPIEMKNDCGLILTPPNPLLGVSLEVAVGPRNSAV